MKHCSSCSCKPLWDHSLVKVDYYNDVNKFWRIRQEGYTVYINFGRTGTEGQTLIKKFSTSWRAEDYVWDRVVEKKRDGYRTV